MRKPLLCSSAILVLLPLGLFGADAPNKNGAWPQWRGPERNAICAETGLLKTWPKGGPQLLWDSRKVNQGHSVGTGFSSLAITEGKIFTMGDRLKAGYVFCLDAETGKELWKTKIGPAQDDGPHSTPSVDNDRVYALTRRPDRYPPVPYAFVRLQSPPP